MASRKEYQLAIKIAGEIEKSLPQSARLAKSELRAISKEAVKSTQGMNGAFSRSSMSVTDSLTSINKVGDKVFKAVGKAAKVAGAALGVGLGGAVKVGSEFEKQMSTVGAISGATGEDLDRLSEKALKMGSTTSFTAAEAGQAMEYMAMAGWKTEDMLSGISGMMDLAAASGEDLATTSDIVTDALTAFGMKAEDAGHFSDVLAKASSNANTNVGMMGETFKYVGATAGAMGYDIEDVATSIGLMANSGIKASQGGTALRKIMTETAGGVTLTGKAFAKAGETTGKFSIATSDANGKMKPWSETVNKLREAFSKMTDEEKTANAEAIAGKTGMSGLLAIVNASEKDYRKLTDEIENATGASKEMANTRLDNLSGDVTLFKSALEGAGITVYKELQEPLRNVVQWGTEVIGDFAEGFEEAFPAIREAVMDVGEAFEVLATPFLAVGGWLLDNPTVIAGALGAIGAALITYKVAAGIIGVVNAISSFASLNPAILAIGAAAAAIGGIAAATAVAAREAKEASLDEAFGNIALSMDDLDEAARNIIGRGDLRKVDDLLNAISDSDAIAKGLEETKSKIEKIRWKIKTGIEISKGDKEEYVQNVKQYMKDCQDLVEQKGYEVEISTKLLFGNEKRGLLKGNDRFYAGLDEQLSSLSDKLNSRLKKAMDKGLDIDTDASVQKILNQIQEITERVNQAEADAEWDMLGTEWSGKDLTASSYEALQEQLNETLDKEFEGIDEAAKSELTTINARTIKGVKTEADLTEKQKKQGYISEEKAESLKGEVTSRATEKKDAASERSAKFQYNTLMETYGEKLASGEMSQADRDALNELTANMMENSAVKSSSYGSNIETLNWMSEYDNSFWSSFDPTNQGGNLIRTIDALLRFKDTEQTNVAEAFAGNPDNVKGIGEMWDSAMTVASGEEYFGIATARAQEMAQEYLSTIKEAQAVKPPVTVASQDIQAIASEEMETQGNEGGNAFIEGMTSTIDSDNTVSEAAKKTMNLVQQGGLYGKQTGDEFIRQLQNSVDGQTVTVHADIKANTPSIPTYGGISKGTVKVKEHALGGIFSSPHIGMVGEAGTEAVIPIQRNTRSYDLFAKTGQMLGFGNAESQNYSSFAPVVNLTVNAGSGTDGEKVAKVSAKEIEKVLRKLEKDRMRASFA